MTDPVTLTSEECEQLARALSNQHNVYHVSSDGKFALTVASIIEERLAQQEKT